VFRGVSENSIAPSGLTKMPPSLGAEVSTLSGGIVYCFLEPHFYLLYSRPHSSTVRTWDGILLSFVYTLSLYDIHSTIYFFSFELVPFFKFIILHPFIARSKVGQEFVLVSKIPQFPLFMCRKGLLLSIFFCIDPRYSWN
jgi:hypothetical protein